MSSYFAKLNCQLIKIKVKFKFKLQAKLLLLQMVKQKCLRYVIKYQSIGKNNINYIWMPKLSLSIILVEQHLLTTPFKCEYNLTEFKMIPNFADNPIILESIFVTSLTFNKNHLVLK